MKNKSEIIFGLHTIQALLEKSPHRIQKLCFLKGREDQKIKKLLQLTKDHGIPYEYLSRFELDKISQGENHQGVIGYVGLSITYDEHSLEDLIATIKNPLLLILDGVQDPHNLGACLRSADAAGVQAVIVPRDKAVGITSTVSKVASGAAETVPFIQVTNLARTMRFLKDKGIWIYGADSDSQQTLYNADFKGSTAIALGAEGSGLRRLTKEHCDSLLKIPMQGSVSSLNVSVATGIFLFESVRQRQLIKRQ